MSLQSFISTVETDLTNVFHTIEADTESALTWLWGVAKPVFTAIEPTVAQDVLEAISTFLSVAAADVKAGTPQYIAETFKQTLVDTGHELLSVVENLGDDLLTVFAGLAKTAAG